MPPAGFEPTISAGEQPQTYALDRAATGTGNLLNYYMPIYTRAVRKVSIYSEYLENWSRGLDVTWQPVRGNLTVRP